MADESSVYIEGSSPDWAVEKALDSIVATLQKTQKVEEEQKKVLKDATSGGKLFDKQAWKEWTSGLKKATQAGVKQGKANEGLVTSTKELTKEFKETSKTFKGVMIGAGLIGGALGGLYEHFKSTIEVFTKLTDSGLSVNMSYRDLSRSLANVGMSLKTFEDLSMKYSTVLGKMGPAEFMSVVKGVGDNFFDFGLTMAEGAEWTAEYLEQHRALGNYSIYNQKNLNEAVRSNVERLTAYSKILNVSRSELQASQTAAAQDDMVQLRLMSKGADEAKAMGESFREAIAIFSSFQAQDMAQDFTGMFGFDDVMMSQDFQEYWGTTASEFTDALGELHAKASAGIRDGMQGDIENLGKLASEYVDDNAAILAQAEGQLTPQQKAMKDLAKGYEQWMEMDEDERKRLLDTNRQANAMVKATSALSTNVDRLKLSFLYFTNDVLERLIGILGVDGTEAGAQAGIEGLATAAGNAAQWLMDLADGEKTWSSLFSDIGDWVWSGIKDGFKAIIDSLKNALVLALDRVVAAVNRMNPFADESDMERHLGFDETQLAEKGLVGDDGLMIAKLQVARANLAEAEAEIRRHEQGMKNLPNAYNPDALPQAQQDYANAAGILAELIRMRREMQKNTEAVEDGNG